MRARFPGGPNYIHLKTMMRKADLHTVCEEAHCPNIGECWEAGTATFLILGDTCTRSCGFCAIKTGRPLTLDFEEPLRVAQTVKTMGVRHAVVTSVNRDELKDGGASIFAATIREIRRACPGTTVEVLIPDFKGNWDALQAVVDERPEILNHNTETVPRLYHVVRPQARYAQSLELLRRAKAAAPEMTVKTGIMVGLGETRAEISQTMRDIAAHECDILTVGQYLRPTADHLPVDRFYTPAEFAAIAVEGRSYGLRHVEAGPLVRSSYHAERHVGLGEGDLIPLEAVTR
jgi:lipoic acid synthetase